MLLVSRINGYGCHAEMFYLVSDYFNFFYKVYYQKMTFKIKGLKQTEHKFCLLLYKGKKRVLFTLRKDYRMSFIENRLLRKIFQPQWQQPYCQVIRPTAVLTENCD